MQHDTNRYLVHGVWYRQKELLEEARRLHVAGRAVREARRAERNGPVRAAVAGSRPAPGRSGSPRSGSPRSGSPLAERAALPPRSLPAWRAAAARMGSSLVAAGERLERFAVPAAERR